MRKRFMAFLMVAGLVAFAGAAGATGSSGGGSVEDSGNASIKDSGNSEATGIGTGTGTGIGTGIGGGAEVDVENKINQAVKNELNSIIANGSKADADSYSKSLAGSASNLLSKIQANPSQSLSIGGDSTSVKTYVMHAPNTVAQLGQSASSMYSIFGGVNLADSDRMTLTQQAQNGIIVALANGLITADEAKLLNGKLMGEQARLAAVKPRILGFGPTTEGKHLANLGGILAMDNWWAKIGDAFFSGESRSASTDRSASISDHRSSPIRVARERTDTETKGNGGNLPGGNQF